MVADSFDVVYKVDKNRAAFYVAFAVVEALNVRIEKFAFKLVDFVLAFFDFRKFGFVARLKSRDDSVKLFGKLVVHFVYAGNYRVGENKPALFRRLAVTFDVVGEVGDSLYVGKRMVKRTDCFFVLI